MKKHFVICLLAMMSWLCLFRMDAVAAVPGTDGGGAVIQGVPAADVQLVMLGDSITDNLRKSEPPLRDFQPIWKKYYAPYHAVNFGVSGCKTVDVIRRIQGGLLDQLQPRVVMLLIGTNDTGTGRSVEQTVEGISDIVKLVHAKLPTARILVLGILPNDIRDWHVIGAKDPAAKWAADRLVNQRVEALLRDVPYATFLNMEKSFLNADNTVNEQLFYDPWEVNFLGRKCGPLHPNTQGALRMAEAVEPVLKRLAGSSDQ